MTLPLAILLIPYALFLFVYGFFILANLYHLFKYALEGTRTFSIVVGYLCGTLLILGISVVLILNQDWTVNVSMSELFGGNSDYLYPQDL